MYPPAKLIAALLTIKPGDYLSEGEAGLTIERNGDYMGFIDLKTASVHYVMDDEILQEVDRGE